MNVSTHEPSILFIDDEPEVMKEYSHQFEEARFRLTRIETADETLDMLSKNPPIYDGVLLDITMPAGKRISDKESKGGLLTGQHLYKKIREKYPQTPVIVFSNRKPENLTFKEKRGFVRRISATAALASSSRPRAA